MHARRRDCESSKRHFMSTKLNFVFVKLNLVYAKLNFVHVELNFTNVKFDFVIWYVSLKNGRIRFAVLSFCFTFASDLHYHCIR